MLSGKALPLILLCGLILDIPAFGQDQPTVFRATSELVLLDVQVLHNKTHAPAPALQAKDFRVFEEGTPQVLVVCSRDEYPLSAVLLFDLTASTQSVLKHLAAGARSTLDHFKPEDEISVMVYSGGATLVDGFTTDRAQTMRAIGKASEMTSDQPAHFNEAVYQAAEQLQHAGGPTNRRVVIWLTDNLPNVPYRRMSFPVHTEIEAFRALDEQGVVVAPILMKGTLWSVIGPLIEVSEASHRKAFPPGDANKYAELTGGQAVGLRGGKPEDRLAQLIDELRARYTLGYRPSDPQPAGTLRKMHVELAPGGSLRPKEWSVLARRGYYRK